MESFIGRIWPLKNNSSAEVMDSGEAAAVEGSVEEKSNSNEVLQSRGEAAAEG